MRLNRYLSQCGVASRRGCEQIILEGRVSINGRLVKELATQVESTDEVQVDGKPVKPAAGIVVAFHKPKGFICSRGDTHDRATIYAILPPQYQGLHYVGRLDKESEGLLLLTNRGELSQRLTHPSEGVEKEYEVTIDQDFQPEHKLKLLHGMMTEEGHAKAERVWVDSSRRIFVVLKQGLKRQIRLMFYQLGYEVERLVRVRVGGLSLKGLSRGAWKELTDAEIERYFIKHKERERTAPPAKARKARDDDGDSFSSETPVSPAPFKLRPGPKSPASSVRKPRRFTKTDEDARERPASGRAGSKTRKPFKEDKAPPRKRAASRFDSKARPAFDDEAAPPRGKRSSTGGPKFSSGSRAERRPGAAKRASSSSGKPAGFGKKPGGFKSGNKPPRGKGRR